MAIFLVIMALLGMGWLLWYSNKHVNGSETWVYQVIAAAWAIAMILFASRVWFG